MKLAPRGGSPTSRYAKGGLGFRGFSPLLSQKKLWYITQIIDVENRVSHKNMNKSKAIQYFKFCKKHLKTTENLL